MARKLRSLRSGEHRYISISGRMRIAKPKNYSLWKAKRQFEKSKDVKSKYGAYVWIYNVETERELVKRYYPEKIRLAKEERLKREIIKEKPIVKKKIEVMYRLSIAINYSVHHRYYSYKIQTWGLSRSKLAEKIEDLKTRVESAVTRKLKYSKEDWWFPPEPNISIQDVPYNEKLVGVEREGDEYLEVRDGKQRMRDTINKRDKHKPLDEI